MYQYTVKERANRARDARLAHLANDYDEKRTETSQYFAKIIAQLGIFVHVFMNRACILKARSNSNLSKKKLLLLATIRAANHSVSIASASDDAGAVDGTIAFFSLTIEPCFVLINP
jgi:hypothetical protein